jgi:hypothetical protein
MLGGAGGLLDPWGYPTCRGRQGFSMERDEGQYDDPIPIFWAGGAAFVVRTAAMRGSAPWPPLQKPLLHAYGGDRPLLAPPKGRL